MQRRQFLLGTAGVTVALAGCSGGDSADDGNDENGDDGESGDAYPIPGELRGSEDFEAIDLAGKANDDNTLTLRGELRYTGEESVVVSGMFYNYYDTDGKGLISASIRLDEEQTVANGDTVTYEHSTEDLGKVEADTVGSFEAIVSSRPA